MGLVEVEIAAVDQVVRQNCSAGTGLVEEAGIAAADQAARGSYSAGTGLVEVEIVAADQAVRERYFAGSGLAEMAGFGRSPADQLAEQSLSVESGRTETAAAGMEWCPESRQAERFAAEIKMVQIPNGVLLGTHQSH